MFTIVSRTCPYVVIVENVPYILFRACFVIVAILQRWVNVVVKTTLFWEELQFRFSQYNFKLHMIYTFQPYIRLHIIVLETSVQRYTAISNHFHLLIIISNHLQHSVFSPYHRKQDFLTKTFCLCMSALYLDYW